MKRLLILVFVTIFFQAVFGQKQKLGFTLAVGQIYYQIMKYSRSIKLENKNGPKANFDLTLSSKMAFKVTGLKDSIYNISVSFQQLSSLMKPTLGGFSFNFDNKNENDTFSNVLKAVIDRPFLVKMTTLGRIVEVKNVDSIFEHALEEFPKLSLEQKLQFKGQFMEAFGEDVFKDNLEKVTQYIPITQLKKVTIGQ